MKMSFAEIAASRPSNAVCTIGAILAGLPDNEAEIVRDMLAASVEVWPHTGGTEPRDSIQQAFRAEGYEVTDRPIRAHRAGACKCFRDNA